VKARKILVGDPGFGLGNSLGNLTVTRDEPAYPGFSTSAAIVGVNKAQSGSAAYGLYGRATGANNDESVGVRADGRTHGVYAEVSVYGSGSAVFGDNPGENTKGFLGEPLAGVYGTVAQNADELASKAGVEGFWVNEGEVLPAFAGAGVWGEALSNGVGVWGVNDEDEGYAVFSSGNFGATGVKNFVAPNPVDPSTEIRFVCLEGNEAGTYFRGSAFLEGGVAVIEVPEEFRHVTDKTGMTVQVTPNGPSMLWVESKSLDQIVVRGSSDLEFDYFVNGVRRGFRDIDIVAPNRSYRPTEVDLPFGEGLAPEVRQILVDNGTLNPDFTPNLATASGLGWKLAPAGTEAARKAARKQRMEPLPEPLTDLTSVPEVQVRRPGQ
jgi:hypothetical protein